jgi:hypothetical protein
MVAFALFPGEGLDIPIWILSSSTDSAYLAAAKSFVTSGTCC